MASTPKTSASVGKHPLPNLRVGGFVGDACNENAQCRPGLFCLGVFGDNQGVYPQGYCSTLCPKDTCFDDAAHPYTRCVNWKHESEAICMIACNDQGRCDRVGYECGRADRSDGEGTRYVCTPRPGSASNALEAAKVDGVLTPPPGTTTVPALVRLLKGTPAEFTVSRFAAPASPLAAPPVEGDATPTAELAAPPIVPDVPEGGQALDAPPAPRVTETATVPATDVEFTARREPDALNPLSIGIIAVVALISIFSLIRLLTSSRVGGVLRDIRTATDDETPLERIRRQDRRKKVRSGAVDDPPEVRVQRRLPTRPLRGTSTHVGVDREDMPVMRREEAIARQILPDEPVSAASSSGNTDELALARDASASRPPSLAQPARATEAASRILSTRAEASEEASASRHDFDPASGVGELDGEHGASDGASHDVDRAAAASSTTDERASTRGPRRLVAIPPPGGRRAPTMEDGPQRPVDWMEPPNLDNPLMDVGRPLATRLWAGARVARTQHSKRVDRMDDHLPTLIEMDEFVPPLPIDMVMQLLDELLRYAEQMRQKKGYDAIVYVETDPRRTWFRRGPEGKIRIHHAPDAFAKPALAIDSMRRKGFPASLRPSDAHMLSLVHLGRYLLGSSSHDEVMASVDDLASASLRFSDEERTLVEFLLAPEENEHLRRVSDDRRRSVGATRFAEPSALASQAFRASQQRAPSVVVDDMLPCPDCASEVTVGDLACRHCGVALHPRPAFCAACGTRNILLADGRSQQCQNIACNEELVHGATHADVEGRRLSIIAELLSTFEEFRKIPSRGDQERYEARQQGRRVEVWQIPADRGIVLVEDERPRYALGAHFTLPARSVERSGINFVVYDPPAEARHPLYSLGGEALAEQLLVLLTDVHDAKLRLPGLTVEDLSVSDNGEVCLLHGHRLRVATAPTPRLTDTRFTAPELARQALATERSDLYTVAAIWYYATAGAMPGSDVDEEEVFMQVPDIIRDMMKRALRQEPSDRPESARKMLAQLRGRRRIDDLV